MRSIPEDCSHIEAHYHIDLDRERDGSGVDRQYQYICPECGLQGPLSPLEGAKRGFRREAESRRLNGRYDPHQVHEMAAKGMEEVS